MPSPSAPLSFPQVRLGVRVSDRSPCLGLAGGSQGSPRVPAKGSEFSSCWSAVQGTGRRHPPAQDTPPPQQPTVMDKPGPPQCSCLGGGGGVRGQRGSGRPREPSHALQGSPALGNAAPQL